MAPSAPLPLPPPVPLTAFLEGDGTVHPSNGHDDSPVDVIPPTIAPEPKLPGKSNLKRHSMFDGSLQLNHDLASLRRSHSFGGQMDYGLGVSNTMEREVPEGESKPVTGNGADVDVGSDGNYSRLKRKDSRVTWTDNHGKDLAEVWEFEPSDTGDSDEESDSDSSQACTCVIQ